MDLGGLKSLLEQHRPGGAAVSAVRVDGWFDSISLRSVHAPPRPYPPLAEVTAHQNEWSLGAVEGTVVGFRFPDASAGVEVPGYHLHFVSRDRTSGGHVLALQLSRGALGIQGLDDLHVELPPGVGLADPAAADRAAIRAVEGG